MEIQNQIERPTQELRERPRMGVKMAAWQRWLQHPEHFWVHKALFQIHLWLGAGVGLYVVVMSLTGSVIVYRNELSRWFSVEWLVNLHENSASWAGRTCRERHWRTLRDGGLFDGSHYMVAGNHELASQRDRELGSSFSAVQLGSAQRVRVLVLFLYSDVGNLRDLFFFSTTV